MLTQREIERRKPIWQALSELWKDTELFDYELSYIAEKMRSSNYSLEEIEKILASTFTLWSFQFNKQLLLISLKRC